HRQGFAVHRLRLRRRRRHLLTAAPGVVAVTRPRRQRWPQGTRFRYDSVWYPYPSSLALSRIALRVVSILTAKPNPSEKTESNSDGRLATATTPVTVRSGSRGRGRRKTGPAARRPCRRRFRPRW